MALRSISRDDDFARKTSLEEFAEFIALPENEDKRYELIDGCVEMMSGNMTSNHQRISLYIASKINRYLDGKTCEVFQDLNVYLYREDMGKCENVFQPDILVGCDKDKMTDRGYEGTPEFIAEVVSKSTAWNDYSVKCGRYMEFGVKEYWIVDYYAKQILVYTNGGENPPAVRKYTFADEVKAGVFEDLSIDFREIAKIIH